MRIAGGPRTGDRRLSMLAVGAALLVPLVLTILVSVRAERARRPELSSLRPLASLAATAGKMLATNPRITAGATGGIAAAVLAAVALFGFAQRRKESFAPALALFACAFAALGEVQLVLGHLRPGVMLYFIAVPLFAASLVLVRKDPAATELPGERIPLWAVAAALVAVAWTGLLYRFYALGQFPPNFDGESSWFMACATSLYGAAQINFGADGPWSPFGWLYYLPILFFTRICGTTLLSIRLVSAVTGFLALPLFFGLLRRMAGNLEAVLGTVFLCFGMTELFWSRTDIFPYHAPGLVAIALAWASFEAITTERLRYFVAAAALMALSYHQYPSGQTSFLIPVGAILGHSFFARGFLRRSWKGLLVVLLGVVLWAAGLGINGLLAGAPFEWRNPFALSGGKTLWSLPLEKPGAGARAKFLVNQAVRGVGIIVRTQFVDVVPSDFPRHENVPALGSLTRRHLSAPVAVLLALGLTALLMRPTRPASLVLSSWLVAGSLPGLLSTFPSSRRIATMFPAFMAVAALAGGLVLRSATKLLGEKRGRVFAAVALAGTFAGLGAVAGFLYLGSPTSTVPAVAAADAIRPYLKPGTLAVFESEYLDWTTPELTYLLLDELNSGPRPAIWRIAQLVDWPAIAFRPTPNPASWVYKYTMLHGRAAPLAKDPGLDRVTFLVQDTDARKMHRDLLTQIYPEIRMQHLHVSDSNYRFNFAALTVDASTLKDNQCPIVNRPAGAAAAAPADWWEGVEVRLKQDGPPSAPVTISSGLWLPDLRRISLRFSGAGEGAKLLLDGVRYPEGEIRPVTRGIHRLDLTLGSSPKLPLRLEQTVDGRAFETVQPRSLTSPRLAALPSLAGEKILMYAGFDPPIPIARFEPGFMSDIALAPDGSIVAVRSFQDSWRLELRQPDGTPARVWEQRRPAQAGAAPLRTAVACLADTGIAFLSWPHLYIYDRQGKLEREIDLKGMANGAEGLAANEEGQLFVLSRSRHGVVVLSRDGRETGLLKPKDADNWLPWTLSAAYRGPVAVIESSNRIRIFEETPSGWEETRVQPGWYAVNVNRYAVRADGWLFSQDSNGEVVVFDRKLRRRLAAEPLHDLSRFPLGNRFLGFDREGRLYTETDGHVACFVPTGPKVLLDEEPGP